MKSIKMLPRTPTFAESSIKVNQSFIGTRRHGLKLTTTGRYDMQMATLNSAIRRMRGLTRKQQDTILVFSRNYYTKHNELPSMESLQKVFPYIKIE